jgi:hypothetical protein
MVTIRVGGSFSYPASLRLPPCAEPRGLFGVGKAGFPPVMVPPLRCQLQRGAVMHTRSAYPVRRATWFHDTCS